MAIGEPHHRHGIENPAARCFTALVVEGVGQRPTWLAPVLRSARELSVMDTRTPELKELTTR